MKLQQAPHDTQWLNGTEGLWRGAKRDGKRTAIISCPKCRRAASLSEHDIDAAGKVTPSLVCPYGDCDFHDYVELEGWARRE
jgi:hypothetical protein